MPPRSSRVDRSISGNSSARVYSHSGANERVCRKVLLVSSTIRLITNNIARHTDWHTYCTGQHLIARRENVIGKRRRDQAFKTSSWTNRSSSVCPSSVSSPSHFDTRRRFETEEQTSVSSAQRVKKSFYLVSHLLQLQKNGIQLIQQDGQRWNVRFDLGC